MITGLIPNQIFVNKLWAMSQLSLMTTAFPKVVYDATRVGKWDNRIGAAIGIQGGDVNNVAKIIDPASISPQISQFIQLAVEETEQSLGATSVALGDTRPDNTSAIIALQRLPPPRRRLQSKTCISPLRTYTGSTSSLWASITANGM